MGMALRTIANEKVNMALRLHSETPLPSLIFVLVFLGTLTSCSKELSRGKAISLLSEHPPFTKTTVTIRWKIGGHAEWVARGGIQNLKMSSLITNAERAQVTLSLPARLEVAEVTGITEVPLMPNVRQASFRAKLSDVPPSLQRLIVTELNGEGYFVRYDDGWRIDPTRTHLQFPSESRLRLPPAEGNEQNEITSEIHTERRRVEDMTKRWRQLLEESKRPSRDIVKFQAQYMVEDRLVSRFAVTDAGLRTDVPARPPNPYGQDRPAYTKFAWYGCVSSVDPDESDNPKRFYIQVRGMSYCRQSQYPGTGIALGFETRSERDAMLEQLTGAFWAWRGNHAEIAGKCQQFSSEVIAACLPQ
jgi:hypothetical protein